MDYRVFRIATTFERSYSVFLGFLKGRLYLGFPEDATLLYFYGLHLVILIAEQNISI